MRAAAALNVRATTATSSSPCVVDAQRQPARPPTLDARAQGFEPPREPGGDRKGGQTDAAGDDQHNREDAQAGPRARRAQMRQHDAPVGEVDAQDARHPAIPLALAGREPDGKAVRCGELPVRSVDRDVGVHLVAEALRRGGKRRRRTAGRGKHSVVETDFRRPPALLRAFAHEPPERAHQRRDGDEARQQRQIHLPEQPATHADHGSPSCFRAKT